MHLFLIITYYTIFYITNNYLNSLVIRFQGRTKDLRYINIYGVKNILMEHWRNEIKNVLKLIFIPELDKNMLKRKHGKCRIYISFTVKHEIIL